MAMDTLSKIIKKRLKFLILILASPLVLVFLLEGLKVIPNFKDVVFYLGPDLYKLLYEKEWGGLILALLMYGTLFIPIFVLFFEAYVLGYEKSGLKRLLEQDEATTHVDRAYLFLRVSGLMHLLATILSFGLCFSISSYLSIAASGRLATDLPLILQIIIFFILQTFLFYWAHRLMHTKWLWLIHKVHHSAEEMNSITPLRNHPIDLAVMSILYACPIAVFGFDPVVMVAYAGINGVYQCAVHSNIQMKSPILNYIS